MKPNKMVDTLDYPMRKSYSFLPDTSGHQETDHTSMMMYEWARFRSFEDFPRSAHVSGLRLAQNGFYYTGHDQSAKCFSCGLVNDQWPEEESVSQIHARLSPSCRLVRGVENSNIGISNSRNNSRSGPSGNNGMDTSKRGGAEGDESNMSNNGRGSDQIRDNESSENERNIVEIVEETATPSCVMPKYPSYANKTDRLRSFTGWIHGSLVPPEQFAEAGLFFTGIDDCVRCFYCGGGLRSWESGDSPCVEHARWFPSCWYVLKTKGQDFVDLCSTATVEEEIPEQLVLNQNAGTAGRDKETEDLKTSADDDTAYDLLQIVYSAKGINGAIQELREERGFVAFSKSYVLDRLLDSNSDNLSEARQENCLHSEGARKRTCCQNNDQVCDRKNKNNLTTNKVAKVEQKNTSEDSVKSNKPCLEEGDDESNILFLRSENDRLKGMILCKLCRVEVRKEMFLPCGHLISCISCAKSNSICAVCKRQIHKTISVKAPWESYIK